MDASADASARPPISSFPLLHLVGDDGGVVVAQLAQLLRHALYARAPCLVFEEFFAAGWLLATADAFVVAALAQCVRALRPGWVAQRGHGADADFVALERQAKCALRWLRRGVRAGEAFAPRALDDELQRWLRGERGAERAAYQLALAASVAPAPASAHAGTPPRSQVPPARPEEPAASAARTPPRRDARTGIRFGGTNHVRYRAGLRRPRGAWQHAPRAAKAPGRCGVGFGAKVALCQPAAVGVLLAAAAPMGGITLPR